MLGRPRARGRSPTVRTSRGFTDERQPDLRKDAVCGSQAHITTAAQRSGGSPPNRRCVWTAQQATERPLLDSGVRNRPDGTRSPKVRRKREFGEAIGRRLRSR
jgi:hypothetical protein